MLLILKSYAVGLSSSRISESKTGVIDSAQCFSNKDCIPYLPYMDCNGLVAVCQQGACYCNDELLVTMNHVCSHNYSRTD